MLDHERLEVYRVARELSREICGLSRRVRPGRPDLLDQLLRATASVPLNIAEGSAETSPARRAYFFRIARSSATEVASALEHMADMRVLADSDVTVPNGLVVRIVSMLVRLTADTNSRDSLPALRRRGPRKTR